MLLGTFLSILITGLAVILALAVAILVILLKKRSKR